MHARSILTIALSSLALASGAQAVTLLNTGFEAPEYAIGNLVGQNGWDAVGFFNDDVVSVNVQNSVVKSGFQAVSLTGSGEGAGAFAYTLTPFTPSGSEQIVTVGFDMQWGTSGATRSYLYGVQIYDEDLNLVAGVGASQVLGFYSGVALDDTGGPVAIPGADLSAGDWHRFELTLDYGTKTYRGSMDGFSTGDLPFITPDATTFGEADLFRDAGLGNANDTAYFDNLSSITSVVPEPASLGMLGGLVAMTLRRR